MVRSSTKIQPSYHGKAVYEKLPIKQRNFVNHLLTDLDFNGKAAAIAAGYSKKGADVAAAKLLNNKNVSAAIGYVMRKREERVELKQDDVVEYLRNVLLFNPLEYFKPSKDGWLVEDPDSIPPEIGRMIDGIELKVTELPSGGKQTYFKVTLISKATALTLAMKHVVDKNQADSVRKMIVDWSNLYDEPAELDEVEQRLIEVEGKVQ